MPLDFKNSPDFLAASFVASIASGDKSGFLITGFSSAAASTAAPAAFKLEISLLHPTATAVLVD